MNGTQWGPEGPPPEAYSRITNSERFEPLHRAALLHLERLQERFDVERVEGYGLDQDLERVDLARPSVKLIPADSKAAPIVVAFTSFPAVITRCGLRLVLGFPACGCDACDETAEGELQRLTEVMDDVVGGRFRESIRIPLFGDAEQEWELRSSAHRIAGSVRIPRSRARALVSGCSRTFEWSPWPLREGLSSARYETE
jgi:hypothetical protein